MPPLQIPGAKITVHVSSRDTGGRYTICEIEVADASAPLHTHSYEDTLFFIVAGDFTFQIGTRAAAAPKGTTLFIPRNTPYALQPSGAAPSRLLAISHPGGLDLFFQDLSGRNPNLPAILEKHGIGVVP